MPESRTTPHRMRFLSLCLTLSWISLLNDGASAQGAGTVGQWSDTTHFFNDFPGCALDARDFGGAAVHMSLLRNSQNATGVLYTNNSRMNGLFLWTQNQGINSDKIRVPLEGHEIFCAGHVPLSDGKLFVVGGSFPASNTSYNTGPKSAVTFDMNGAIACQSGAGWSPKQPMAEGRWYPSATILSDGRVLTLSGNRYDAAIVFGGKVGGVVSNDLRALYQYQPLENTLLSLTGAPAARTGHVAVFDRNAIPPFGRMLVAGGEDANGAMLGMTVYALNRDDKLTPGETRSWSSITASGGPTGRTRAGAAMGENDQLFLYGGKNGSGQALNELWRLTFSAPGSSSGTWAQLGNAPYALYGHSATWDESGDRLVIFGGTDGSTVSSRLLVWTTANGWSEPVTTGEAPSAREGHAVAYSPGGTGTDDDTLWVSGGRNGSTFYGDLYSLKLSNLHWEKMNPAQTFTPRAEHTMLFDIEIYKRILVFGGTGASGDLSDCWSYSRLPWFWPPSSRWNWIQEPIDPVSASRSGHTMFYDTWGVLANTPEIYDPVSNTWEYKTSWRRYLPTYPQMHLLPNGELLFAGRGHETRKLNLTSGWAASPIVSAEEGLASVQYAPGKIMKTGGHGYTETITFDASGGTTGWQHPSGGDLPGMGMRDHFNLTMLPTGEVLMTNGTADMAVESTPTRIPYIWTPPAGSGAGTWSGALAEENEGRGYHSTALLLPDATVLSAGGFTPNPQRMYARIYSPPYLFHPVTNLPATRPVIDSCPDQIGYVGNQAKFYVCLTGPATDITKVSLIRAGSTTHMVNMGQKFVPLSFTTDGTSGCHRIKVTPPANSNVAPPGDYLLFVVNTLNVPSVAKWIRVGAASSSNPCPDECDIPPNTISDLSLTVFCEKLRLTWTAPGDDGTVGQATLYDLRRSINPITNDGQFYAATPVTVASPQTSGSSELKDDVLGKCSPTYYYRLKARDDGDNWSAMSNQVMGATNCPQPHTQCWDFEESWTGMPSALELIAPWPNPTRGAVHVAYAIPSSSIGNEFDLSIYNVAGRKMTTLAAGRATPGRHLLRWDSEAAVAGVYFVRLRTPGKTLSQSVIRLP